MVYFVTDGSGFVKIGVAKNLRQRLREIQTGNPRDIRVLKVINVRNNSIDYDMEKALHKYYKDARVKTINGKTEWFDLSKRKDILFLTASKARSILHDLHPKYLTISSYSSKENNHALEEISDYLNSKTYGILFDEGFKTVESVEEYFKESSHLLCGIGDKRAAEIRWAIKQFYKDMEVSN